MALDYSKLWPAVEEALKPIGFFVCDTDGLSCSFKSKKGWVVLFDVDKKELRYTPYIIPPGEYHGLSEPIGKKYDILHLIADEDLNYFSPIQTIVEYIIENSSIFYLNDFSLYEEQYNKLKRSNEKKWEARQKKISITEEERKEQCAVMISRGEYEYAIIIDGKEIDTPKELHLFLNKELDFPWYYGNNPDALWECICCDIDPPVLITWKNYDESLRKFKRDAKIILSVLQSAEEEYYVKLVVE